MLTFAVQVITEFLFDHEMTVFLCVFDRSSYEFSRSLFAELVEWISKPKENELTGGCSAPVYAEFCDACPTVLEKKTNPRTRRRKSAASTDETLEEYLKNMDKPFSYKLFDWIDKRGITAVACYKKANVDKKTFSKIKCNPDTYKPSKQTAVAFAIALELDLDETQELLASAGLTLSRSFVFDRIIRYFIQKKIYNIFAINEALFEFDQTLLGV